MYLCYLAKYYIKRGVNYERYNQRIERCNGQFETLWQSTSADEWCAEYDNDMWLGTYHFNHTVAMDRIKRVVSTPERSGEWQTQQLKEGWYTADFDFDTNEYIMKRCEDLPTITVQQANLLSYKDPNDLTPQQRKILWGDDYG